MFCSMTNLLQCVCVYNVYGRVYLMFACMSVCVCVYNVYGRVYLMFACMSVCVCVCVCTMCMAGCI